jgi:hypothetical protein
MSEVRRGEHTTGAGKSAGVSAYKQADQVTMIQQTIWNQRNATSRLKFRWMVRRWLVNHNNPAMLQLH